MKRAIVLALALCSTAFSQRTVVRNDLHKIFEQVGVSGSFSMYDEKKNEFVLVNPKQFKQQFIPASTFKICNSLIGVETGVIPDENYVIPWDSVKRNIESWNADQDLKSAYRNSCVPYYQELARRVGAARMKFWLDTLGYGNADISGGIDVFWLTGGLRITPEQQINFLRRLRAEQLPLSPRTMQIAKGIMIEEETPSYHLRSKTGLGDRGEESIGWYVGYVEKDDRAYFFATCIQSAKPGKDFAQLRKTLTRKILARLKVL